MSRPVRMTLAESDALHQLDFLVQAILLSDNEIAPATGREIKATLRAVRLFVQAECRSNAHDTLKQVVDVFDDGPWASAVAVKVDRIRKLFRWEEAA
jgi:hypothetical protein